MSKYVPVFDFLHGDFLLNIDFFRPFSDVFKNICVDS